MTHDSARKLPVWFIVHRRFVHENVRHAPQAAANQRDRKQAKYAEDIHRAVVAFLDSASCRAGTAEAARRCRDKARSAGR